jgi:TatD DNase family protein
MLVDTHCHLHLLETPAEEVVAGALAEGVGHLVDVGVDLDSSRQAAANAARLPQVSATAGVHPHDADTLDGPTLDGLRRLLADERVVGVGETGLDYHYDNSPRPDQRAAFAAHVAWPASSTRPWSSTAGRRSPTCWPSWTARGRRRGWCSTASPATSGRRPGGRGRLVRVVRGHGHLPQRPRAAGRLRRRPLERMVLETDSPFLSPHPYRGRPNRPGRVAVTAQTVAEVHGVPVERVAERHHGHGGRGRSACALDGRG